MSREEHNNPTNNSEFDMIEVERWDWEQKVEAQIFLECLEAAGVDSWDGIDIAQEMFSERMGL